MENQSQAVYQLILLSVEASGSQDALRFSQAALNVAHAFATISAAERDILRDLLATKPIEYASLRPPTTAAADMRQHDEDMRTAK